MLTLRLSDSVRNYPESKPDVRSRQTWEAGQPHLNTSGGRTRKWGCRIMVAPYKIFARRHAASLINIHSLVVTKSALLLVLMTNSVAKRQATELTGCLCRAGSTETTWSCRRRVGASARCKPCGGCTALTAHANGVCPLPTLPSGCSYGARKRISIPLVVLRSTCHDLMAVSRGTPVRARPRCLSQFRVARSRASYLLAESRSAGSWALQHERPPRIPPKQPLTCDVAGGRYWNRTSDKVGPRTWSDLRK
jgi:hypothetical protein